MARGKIQMRRIENPVHRQVTFCKRRAGLLKKAKELSVLCDAEIGIIIFSAHGKLYELATKGTMQGLIERYTRAQGEAKLEGSDENILQEPKQEVAMLKQEIDLFQKGLRYMYGEGISGHMTLEELVALERQLEMWMYYTRSAKMQIMFQEIQQLKSKEGILKAANELLQEKVVEQNGLFDVAPLTVDQTGVFNVAPQMIADIPYPLTVQHDMIPILGALY
ncbi:MADS-box transcription factor 26-like [Asparagus officinalis]|uniref:MADS-box transcription factor 26-like n=1 Tax=Asparagus officinalis TaxID=4686 RepID=UPI00098E4C3F|nr:MADS-box transcription factor 26-like [Asparagus officinalis]